VEEIGQEGKAGSLRRQQSVFQGEMATDIVVLTRNRLDCLRQTMAHIMTRTRTPHNLHVIDDASEEGNVEYLLGLWLEREIETLVLRRRRYGPNANLNAAVWLTSSDPVVFTDDDVLCPDVEPDWLARGLAAMEERPRLGILALNHPGQPRHPMKDDGTVTYCKRVGGTFMFIRRKVLENWHLPVDKGAPTNRRCIHAKAQGWQIGYLTDTYCHHIGKFSARTGRPYPYKEIEPIDMKTFERWDEEND
jgi:hypothetical protein